MTEVNTIRRDQIAKYVKYGLALAGCVIISPIIFLAIKGLIGLIIAAFIGFAWLNFAPVVAMKVANWKIKGIVAEAQENPIETLTNLLIEKRKAYELFRENVVNAATAAKDFATKVQDFKRKFPARSQEFEAQLEAMNELVRRKQVALVDAKHTLDEGDTKLSEMKAYWDMSQAAQAANKAAGMDIGDLYEKLKADTAVDAVYTSMNRAFAELETAAALSDDDAPTLLLEHQPANKLTATVRVKQGVAAR